MASPNGVQLDAVIIGIVAIVGVILNYEAKHNPKIRGSGNRWFSRSNSSIIWLFGVLIGALSGAIPALVGSTPQYPIFAVVLVIFLGFVFMTADLYKQTDELVKPKSTAETKVAEPNDSASRPTPHDIAKYFYDLVLVSFFLSIVLAFALLAYSAWYYVSPETVGVVSDMATLFVTVQGVLLAISVISHSANRTFIMFTAMSLMISVITFVIAKVGPPFFAIWGIKNGFGIDAGFFALSIIYYVRVATRNLPKPD